MSVMKTKNRLLAAMSALTMAAVLAPALFVIAPTAAMAAKQSIGAKVGKPLKEAQDLAKSQNWKAAIAKALEADAITPKSAYEDFIVKDFLTYLYAQSKDYSNALVTAEAALNTGQAPKEDVARRVKLIAQLAFQAKNYGKSVTYAQRYVTDYGRDTAMSELITQTYYIQQNYAKALSSSLDMIKAAEAAGQTPAENLLQIALSSAYKLSDKVQSRALLTKLVQHHPKSEYWADLFVLLLGQANNTERTNLEIFRLKLAAGELTDPEEFSEMAQLALQLGLPGEAERLLQKGFDGGILGVGPAASREKRLLTLAKTTAAPDRASLASQKKTVLATPSGNDDVKVGEAFETYSDYASALTLVQGGLAKTGVKNPDEARILLGRIQLALGQKEEARTTFRAVTTDPKMAEIAPLWIVVSRK